MTNEELVAEIKASINVKKNLETLYTQNRGLFYIWLKPYFPYENAEDLLQEAYLALCKAVYGFDESFGIRFSSYLRRTITSHIARYLQKIDSTLASLDMPLTTDNGEFTLGDCVQADSDTEEAAIEALYHQELKTIWGICQAYTTAAEFQVLEESYKHNRSGVDIAKDKGCTPENVRKLRDRGLSKLRQSKALRELQEKLEISEALAMSGCSLSGFKRNFTSCQERYVIDKEKIHSEYLRKIGKI